jgi:hypothetical protein
MFMSKDYTGRKLHIQKGNLFENIEKQNFELEALLELVPTRNLGHHLSNVKTNVP